MMQITLIGHIGKDAEQKAVSGKTVINFRVAVNEKQPDGSSLARWVSCAIWRNEPGKIVQYLTKGQQVFLQGTPDFKIYKKNDKTPGLDISLRVDKVELLGGRKDSTSSDTSTDGDWNFGDNTPYDGSSDPAEDEAFWSSVEEQDRQQGIAQGAN